MALLSAVVAQYELLRTLATHLHHNDLVSLGLASKEYWAYIGKNESVLQILQSLTTRCGGSGSVARQDRECQQHDTIPYTCLEDGTSAASRLCNQCGDVFCNACRFHLDYTRVPHSTNYQYLDEIETDLRSDGTIYDQHRQAQSDHQTLCKQLESKGCTDARQLMATRWIAYCPTCILFQLAVRSDTETFCVCTLRTRFVTKNWLCKPCVQAQNHKSNRDIAHPHSTKPARWKCHDFKRRSGCRMTTRRADRLCQWCRHRLRDDQHPRNSVENELRKDLLAVGNVKGDGGGGSGVVLLVIGKWLTENPRPSPSSPRTKSLTIS